MNLREIKTMEDREEFLSKINYGSRIYLESDPLNAHTGFIHKIEESGERLEDFRLMAGFAHPDNTYLIEEEYEAKDAFKIRLRDILAYEISPYHCMDLIEMRTKKDWGEFLDKVDYGSRIYLESDPLNAHMGFIHEIEKFNGRLGDYKLTIGFSHPDNAYQINGEKGVKDTFKIRLRDILAYEIFPYY